MTTNKACFFLQYIVEEQVETKQQQREKQNKLIKFLRRQSTRFPIFFPDADAVDDDEEEEDEDESVRKLAMSSSTPALAQKFHHGRTTVDCTRANLENSLASTQSSSSTFNKNSNISKSARKYLRGRRAAAVESPRNETFDGFERIETQIDFDYDFDDNIKIIVALGKFDAMHRGHKALAIAAATSFKSLEQKEEEEENSLQAVLLSFENMAEVLGWAPKKPVTAKRDRQRVLNEWSSSLFEEFGNENVIREHGVSFAAIREMSPETFVRTLKEKLGVSGIVAGENYRFGYRASGTSSDLVSFGKKYGLSVKIVPLLNANKLGDRACVEDGCEGKQVSSSRVRACLKFGDVKSVTKLLGRNHRLCLEKVYDDKKEEEEEEEFVKYTCENITPKVGQYKGFLFANDKRDNVCAEELFVVCTCTIVKRDSDNDDDDDDDGYVLIPKSYFRAFDRTKFNLDFVSVDIIERM